MVDRPGQGRAGTSRLGARLHSANLVLPSLKKETRVVQSRLIGGIALLILAALIFLLLKTEASVPIAIALTVVGIALVAGARKKGRQQSE